MITWFTFTVVAITALAALICIVMGLWGKVPSDLTVGAIALVEVLLLVQVVIASSPRSPAIRQRGACWSFGPT